MAPTDRRKLASLVRGRSLAALGTLRDGGPLVSMVLYASEPDLSLLYVHVSRLAQHTSGLLAGPRVSLLIVEPERASRNPLTLARVTIQGTARPLVANTPEFEAARARYLEAHPTTAINFQLPDFLLVGIRPESARFIAGFGQIDDLDREAWIELGMTEIGPSPGLAPSDPASS